MSTEFFNDQWRIPTNSNQNKVSNYSMGFGVPSASTLSISPEVDLGINSTVSIWINKSVNSNVVLIGNSLVSNYLLFIEPTTIYVRINTIFKTFTNSMVLNQWYNIILVRNGDSIEVFQNGNSIGTQSGYGTTFTTKISTIGSKPNASFAYTGLADQVTFLDYALSASQVATLYGGGTAVTNPMSLSPKPIAAYQLGDQSVDNGANYLVPNNSLSDYVFNFSSNRITIPSYTITAASTVSLWVRSSEANPNDVLLGGITGDFYPNLYVQASGSNAGKIIIYLGQSSPSSNSNVVTDVDYAINTWYHLAISQTGGNATVYIDGISKGTIAAKTPVLTSMGAYSSGANDLQGEMSNIAIFNTSLPATGTQSIASLYNNGSPPASISSYSGLQRWYKLNAQDTFDGTNWTIKDYAGSNNGTSVGMDSANLVQSDLQHTSGFSPYSLSLDGTNDFLKLNNFNDCILFNQTSFTISAWIYLSSISTPVNNPILSNLGNVLSRQSYMLRANSSRNIQFSLITTSNTPSGVAINSGNESFEFDKWEHITITFENEELKCYINGSQAASVTNVQGSVVNSIGEGMIGARGTGGTGQVFGGNLSNIAVWQGSVKNPVTLFNSGIPADLTSLNPSAWWQLGSNSSFNTNWTCLNEGSLTSLNAVSAGSMTNDDITNGPGYSANGLGTSSIDIVGDAPYSSGNGLSENMDVLDRVKDTPPT